ncbi:hypothetical protein RGI145_21670 [Roseomonas gilardii]|uniref:Uncharacterized protein n=1 Tax=Roseomonas gilardii TaxID=257708 RepID=A0A1L7AMA2_9PROT|nr:hypothetical protein [Roseomonas gilardii]APT59911.1 hypothetical protein RGI145_21670 [Roseomonas gilardii]
MPVIQQLFRDSDFDATCWWLDWLEDPDRSPNRVAPNCPVAADIPGQRRSARRVGTLRRDFPYVLQQTTVTVATSGLARALRACGSSFECNLFPGDGLLVAARSAAPAGAAEAPLWLSFSRPVKAVGCFVAGSSAVPAGTGFTASAWARLSDQAGFEQAVTVAGVTGLPVLPPAARGAPFLGLRATGSDTIAEVRFDLVPVAPGEVGQIALGTLLVQG